MTIPFTVIGGFLGAGKTTLLNRLLQQANGRRFAVLVNDFGALDIDGNLVAAHGGDTVSLANGCLCCTIGDSLVTTLMTLLERPGRFDHIVVEASGVADPGRIADLAVLEPGLTRDGVVVVVDAVDAQARAADRRLGDTIRRQLATADLLVLNKRDLIDDAQAAALRAWLPGHAPLIEARHADVPLEALFGLPERGRPNSADDAAERFQSWSYDWVEPVDRETLLAMLRDAPAEVLRGKGIVRFADAPGRRAVVHVVGRRIDVSEDGPWCDTDSSRLVLLGVKSVLEFAPRERNDDGTS
jgi:G3E family GTPase